MLKQRVKTMWVVVLVVLAAGGFYLWGHYEGVTGKGVGAIQ